MLNLTQLRSFYETAKHLSFSSAARELCVTQPAVTAQTKLFEEFCKAKLLFRHKSGKIVLTEEGKRVFRHASKLFQVEAELEEYILGLQQLKAGCLRVGTTKNYASWLMPDLMMKFHKAHPNILIELDEGSSLEMAKSITNYKNSLAIAIAKVEDDPDLIFSKTAKEYIVLIASCDHALAKEHEIKLSDLHKQPIIMKELGSGTNKLVDKCFHDQGIMPNIVAQTSNISFIVELVKRRQGVAFVVKSYVQKYLSSGYIVSLDVKNFKPTVDLYNVHLRDFELPPSAKVFLKFATEHLQEEKRQSRLES